MRRVSAGSCLRRMLAADRVLALPNEAFPLLRALCDDRAPRPALLRGSILDVPADARPLGAQLADHLRQPLVLLRRPQVPLHLRVQVPPPPPHALLVGPPLPPNTDKDQPNPAANAHGRWASLRRYPLCLAVSLMARTLGILQVLMPESMCQCWNSTAGLRVAGWTTFISA